MRKSLSRGLVCLVSVALVGSAVQPASARQFNRQRRALTAARSMAAAEIATTLRSAHQLLNVADHDYDGHRALAAREVERALVELGHHKGAGKTGVAAGGKPTTTTVMKVPTTPASKGRESQANSDAQLRQAQQLLQSVLPHLGSHHPKAVGNINAAIGQINTALAIK